MTTTINETLPTWDMTPLYPGLESPEFLTAFEALEHSIADLERLYDQRGVNRRDAAADDAGTAAAVNEVLTATNAFYDRFETLQAYIYAFVTTEADNELAQAHASTLRTRSVTLAQLATRLVSWLGTLDTEALIAQAPVAAQHRHTIERAVIEARHQMPAPEEALVAALEPSSGSAWAKLHDDVTARLEVTVMVGGGAQRLPMSGVRALAFDVDAAVRRAAFAAELSAWQSVETPLAAAINGIKGQVATLDGRREWPTSVAASLHQNGIDAASLAAMHEAVTESLPDFRRYLRAKARMLGGHKLAWWNLFAPIGASSRRWSFAEARREIVEQFRPFSPCLVGLAERAFDERWIDALPRVGKIGGAYCMGVRADESRILANYEGSFDSVTTLAHELGHAYHNVCLAGRTYLQRETPMTLAETASIFCELLLEANALDAAAGPERSAVLDASLQGACQVVVDIHSRFLFEQDLFARRRERELSPEELCQMMTAAQVATYGDGLEPSAMHPYMWAVKGHYYSTGTSFYNYPYTFGQLFGMGLFAQRRSQPDGFAERFDDLLSSTGLADAAALTQRFGIDIHAVDFWRGSLDIIRERIDEFEALAP